MKLSEVSTRATRPERAPFRHAVPGGMVGRVIQLTTLFAAALLDPQPWAADAACREHPELDWFPQRGTTLGPQKAVCATCLVRAECLAYALAQGHSVPGVWGGTSDRERRVMRRTRPEPEAAA